jgi:hypothetical protein
MREHHTVLFVFSSSVVVVVVGGGCVYVRDGKRRRVTLTGIKLKSIGIKMHTIYKRLKVTSRIYIFLFVLQYYVSDNIYIEIRTIAQKNIIERLNRNVKRVWHTQYSLTIDQNFYKILEYEWLFLITNREILNICLFIQIKFNLI